MLARSTDQNIQRVALTAAVGDAIIGEYCVPCSAVNTDVRTLDASGAILDIKDCVHMIAADLSRTYQMNIWRRIVDVHGFADSLTR